MDPLISLIILVVIFAIVAFGCWWLCVKFTMPQPVYWIVGAVLLIILLMFISRELGSGSFSLSRPLLH